MKRIFLFFSILTVFLLLLDSCKKTSEDKLITVSVNTCDTTVVTYSTDIIPILQAKCYRCHGNGNTGGSGGILLEGYTSLAKWAANGFLVGNTSRLPGYVPMPYGEPKLPDCEVNKIAAWVHQGYKNN